MAPRVLYVGYDLHSLGGIQRYSRYELRALSDILGDEALTICSLRPPVGAQLGGELTIDVAGRGTSVGAKLAFARDVRRTAERLEPTLVICDHIVLAPIAFAAARRVGADLCVNVYGLEVWGPLPPWRRFALLRADRIVSDCSFTRRVLEDRFAALRERIEVVHDCVDIERFAPGDPDPELRAALGLDDKPLVLTVSRLAPHRSKGHDVVMQALAGSKEPFTYLVVGDGEDRPRLERLALDLGIADSVVFAGNVDDRDLPAVYRLCDLFVLASGFRLGRNPEGEGVPLVVLEAQACGKPVVTSRLDGSAESIVDGETGFLVDPHDPDEVGAALRRLVTDPPLRERMGAAAREWAVERFSFEVFRGRLERALPLPSTS